MHPLPSPGSGPIHDDGRMCGKEGRPGWWNTVPDRFVRVAFFLWVLQARTAVSGTVTARSAFDGDSEVIFTPCIRLTGLCFQEYEQSGGRICDLMSATSSSSSSSSSSSDCGSAGTYSIDQAFAVPDEVIIHRVDCYDKIPFDQEEEKTTEQTS